MYPNSVLKISMKSRQGICLSASYNIKIDKNKITKKNPEGNSVTQTYKEL